MSVVIHNYRWRLGLAEGESKFDDMERRLAVGPAIMAPTITLEGGIGHNPPQEAPQALLRPS